MKEQNRAVIVEIRDSYAAALTESGDFVRVRNEGYSLGQSVLLEQTAKAAQPAQPKRRRARFTAYATMAAGFLLLLLGGFKGYTTPIGVVSLDVNPSIEYSINFFDRVLDIRAVNDDGETILAGLNEQALHYRSVEEAVEATIDTLRANGYLAAATDNDLVLSASSYSEQHAEQIAQRLNARVSTQGDLTVYSISVSKNEVQSAHALGTSAGKLHFVEELEASWTAAESFDADEWIARPVREIISETEYQREGKNEEDGDDATEQTNDASPQATSGQQSTDPEKNQQYQQDGSSEHEQESDESQQQGESKRD